MVCLHFAQVYVSRRIVVGVPLLIHLLIDATAGLQSLVAITHRANLLGADVGSLAAPLISHRLLRVELLQHVVG